MRRQIKPNNLKFKKVNIVSVGEIMSAGNDVAKCTIEYCGATLPAILKIERSKMADFAAETKHLNLINDEGLYNKTPLIYEAGMIKNKYYLVLEAVLGRRLSEIFKTSSKYKNNYLFRYGAELAIIHQISPVGFDGAKQRVINLIPNAENYDLSDPNIKCFLKYLQKSNINFNNTTFIHGDFHYGNVLWRGGKVSGVVDWEYSGAGFKEQDIAWALILRRNQRFMTGIKDMHMFLRGYQTKGTFDETNLKWCLINGYLHFYLMNKNQAYKKRLLKIMTNILAAKHL